MSLDYFDTALELKTVDVSQRLIKGYAAAHHNIDRARDILDPGASVKALNRLDKPSDVEVFIAHNAQSLPLGIPQLIQATPQGLYTETYVLKGPDGDNLLAVAKDLLDHGLALGMSIGFKTHDSRLESTARGRVRRILDYELKEFSFASRHTTANPLATVSDVKARKAMGEGSDTGGGFLVQPQTPTNTKKTSTKGVTGMGYRVNAVSSTGPWQVLADADADGDVDDNRLVGTYTSQEVATSVVLALQQESQSEETDDDDEQQAADGTAAVGNDAMTMPATGEQKTAWSAAEVDTLPDSSFLYVESGTKDSDGRTVPRDNRHLPYKDAAGKVDVPHLRNAIARIPAMSGVDAAKKAELQARARRMLETADAGKTYEEAAEWKTGSAVALRALGYRLLDASETVATELKAMALLGDETKSYTRIRPGVREEVRAIEHDLNNLLHWADTIERGDDGKARVAWLKAQLALTEV